MCTHVRVEGGGQPQVSFIRSLPLCVFETGSHTWLEFTSRLLGWLVSIGLAGQQTAGTAPVLLPSWDYKHIPPHPDFVLKMDFKDWTQILVATRRPFSWLNPLPSPSCVITGSLQSFFFPVVNHNLEMPSLWPSSGTVRDVSKKFGRPSLKFKILIHLFGLEVLS